MNRTTRWVLSGVAMLSLLVGWTAAKAQAADTQPANRTVKGVVKDKDGNAVPEAKVFLFKKSIAHKAHAPTEVGATPVRHRLAAPKATTNAQGEFSFDGLAPGKYAVVAHKRGVGRGHVKVDVTTSDSANVMVTIAPRHPTTRK